MIVRKYSDGTNKRGEMAANRLLSEVRLTYSDGSNNCTGYALTGHRNVATVSTNNTYNSRATILRGGGGPSFCPSLLAQWYNSLYSKAAQLQQQNQLQQVDLWENNPIRQQLGPALVSYGRSRPIAHPPPLTLPRTHEGEMEPKTITKQNMKFCLR